MKTKALMLCGWASLLRTISGEILLECPNPVGNGTESERPSNDKLKDDHKACGGFAGPLTHMEPGLNWVRVQETVVRDGSPLRVTLKIPASSSDGVDQECILLDHVPHDANGQTGDVYGFAIGLPDLDCPECALEITQVVTTGLEKDQECEYSGDPSKDTCLEHYHSCALIRIHGNMSTTDFRCQPPPQLASMLLRGEKLLNRYRQGENGEWVGGGGQLAVKQLSAGGDFVKLSGVCAVVDSRAQDPQGQRKEEDNNGQGEENGAQESGNGSGDEDSALMFGILVVGSIVVFYYCSKKNNNCLLGGASRYRGRLPRHVLSMSTKRQEEQQPEKNYGPKETHAVKFKRWHKNTFSEDFGTIQVFQEQHKSKPLKGRITEKFQAFHLKGSSSSSSSGGGSSSNDNRAVSPSSKRTIEQDRVYRKGSKTAGPSEPPI